MPPKSPQQREAAEKYLKEKVDTIAIRVPKGRKAEIKAQAEAHGQSVNAFVVEAIDEKIKRETEETD